MKIRLLVASIIVISSFAYLPQAEARCCRAGYKSKFWYLQRRPPPPPKWAVGLHVTGLSRNQTLGDDAVAMGGVGGHVRYRGYRWGGELSLDVLGNDFANGHVQRVSMPIQASALFYVLPDGAFNLYLLGGFRVVPTQITWDYPEVQDVQDFTEFGFHGGAGADLHLGRHFSLTADMRLYGVMRSDVGPAGSFYTEADNAIMPDKSVGLQFNLGASVRF